MKRFNWQIFISFNLLFTFFLMLVSGVILYLKPEGSVARWLDWNIMGVDKSGWESVHTVFSFLFLAFALFHILKVHLNNLLGYVFNYRPRGAGRELFISILISAIFLIGTLMYLPPFHFIYQAGNTLSDQWAGRVQVDHESVGPQQSLEEVATEMGMDPAGLKQWMNRQGIENIPSSATLMEHAEVLGVTPLELYRRMESAVGSSMQKAKEKVYRAITLEELAVLFEVDVRAIQDYLSQEFDRDRLAGDASLYDISLGTRYSPREVRTRIMGYLAE